MSRLAIVNSGFIQALIDADDRYNQRAGALFKEKQWVFRVSSVVFAEVFHNRIRDAVSKHRIAHATNTFGDVLLWLTEQPPLRIEEPIPADYRKIAELLKRYADSGIDYVDAVVLALAERFRTPFIMTTDESDFRRYKPSFADHFILPVFDS